jgi:hypothetical protein
LVSNYLLEDKRQMYFNDRQCVLLKEKIDNDTDYGFKYFLTLTWGPRRLVEMRNSIIKRDPEISDDEVDAEMLAWRIKQTRWFFIKLAQKAKSRPHLHPYWALAPDHEHEHIHSLLLSTGKILRREPRLLWEWGDQVDFKEYDPDYGMRHFGDDGRNAVRYIFSKHIAIPNDLGPVCPGKRRSCRSGDCYLRRREFYK